MNKKIINKIILETINTVLLEGQLERSILSLKEAVELIKDRVIIFFDTETTGLSPKAYYRLITEIAAVAYDTSSGERLGEYNMKAALTPAVKRRIEREKQRKEEGTWEKKRLTIEDILKMTAYHDGDTPYQDEKQMMEGFLNFVNSFSDKRPILAAHNAKFDMYQVGKALEAHGLPRMPSYRVVDTLMLSRNYLAPLLTAQEQLATGELDSDSELAKLLKTLRPDNKKFLSRLGNLGQAFEVDTKHWHSAIADTEQLAGILSKMVQYFERHQEIKFVPVIKRKK